MPEYTVALPDGGFMTVNASDPDAARDNAGVGGGATVISGGHAAHQENGTAVGGYAPGYNSGGLIADQQAAAQGQGGNQGMQQYVDAWEKIMQAVAERDEKAFREGVRQFDLYWGLDQSRFAEDIRQFNQTFGLQQGALTGMYQGQPTMAMQQQQFQQALDAAGLTGVYQGAPTLQAQNQAFTQGMGLIGQTAALQANPFRQQAAMGQMSRLLGGQSVAGMGQIGTVPGAGTGGLGYLQQMIDDIRDPAANTAAMNDVLAGIPTPNKLNSVDFFKSPTTTQNMVLQGMSEKYGIDPNDALQQIRNTLPGFRAPSTFGQVRR